MGGCWADVLEVCACVHACQLIFATYTGKLCSCVRMDLARTEALSMVQGGSDTEESDSEQPLTEAEQIVALLNTKAKRPPPLPVDPKHAVSTAAAVRNHILAVPYEKRTIAHDTALRTPVTAQKIETWLEQQLSYRRTNAPYG